MEVKHCNSCAFFRQHYGLDEKKLYRLYCGHCTKAKGRALTRHRKPDAPVCERYEPTEPVTDAFATKEYLSKALLNYVLSLALLPNIEDK